MSDTRYPILTPEQDPRRSGMTVEQVEALIEARIAELDLSYALADLTDVDDDLPTTAQWVLTYVSGRWTAAAAAGGGGGLTEEQVQTLIDQALAALPNTVNEGRFIDLARGYEIVQQPTATLVGSGDLGGDPLDPSSDLDPAGGVLIVPGTFSVGFMGAIANTPTAPLDGALLLGVRLRGVLPDVGAMAGTSIGVTMPTPDFTSAAAGEVTITGPGSASWAALIPNSLFASPGEQPAGPVDITLLLATPTDDPASVTAGCGISNTPSGAPPWTPADSIAVDAIEFLWAMPAAPGGGGTATHLVLTDFGALGTGLVDDTDAVEAAMAELASGDIKTLFIPPGTYAIRRPMEVPGGCQVYGVRGKSILTRYGAGAKAQITEDVLGNVTTLPVDSSAGFSAGDCVLIFDTGNTDWVATFANVVSTTETTITIDREMNSNYIASLDAAVYRAFPFVANTPYHTDDPEVESTDGITLREFTVVGAGIGAEEPTNIFVNGAVHMVQCLDLTIDGVEVVNATTDAISVQGRFPGTPEAGAYASQSLIHNCLIRGAGRHGIHLGTATSGPRVVGNEVADCDDMGLFLCMNVQDFVIEGNVFRNCRQGVAGADARDANGGSLSTANPPSDITGDVRGSITGNTFVGGPKSNSLGAVTAITVGPQFSVVGNVIHNWLTGIVVTPWAVDCVVEGNTVNLSENYGGGSGIVVMPHADRSRVVNNVVRGGTDADMTTKNDLGIQIEGPHEDVLISGNVVSHCSNGIIIGPMNPGDRIRNMKLLDNSVRFVATGGKMLMIYGLLEDCSIDLTGMDSTGSTLFTGVIDIDAGAIMDRVLVNGLGNNGVVDPATGGPWADMAEDGRYQGVEVAWVDGSTPKLSRWLGGIGWITVV